MAQFKYRLDNQDSEKAGQVRKFDIPENTEIWSFRLKRKADSSNVGHIHNDGDTDNDDIDNDGNTDNDGDTEMSG